MAMENEIKVKLLEYLEKVIMVELEAHKVRCKKAETAEKTTKLKRQHEGLSKRTYQKPQPPKKPEKPVEMEQKKGSVTWIFWTVFVLSYIVAVYLTFTGKILQNFLW